MISEADFLRTVLEFLEFKGYYCMHPRHALQRDGKYLTPIQGIQHQGGRWYLLLLEAVRV